MATAYNWECDEQEAKWEKSKKKIEQIEEMEFKNHDVIAGDFVAEVGFSVLIEQLIRNQVEAMRYLAHTTPEYIE